MGLRTFLKSKLHKAVVTQTELDYTGSLTVDTDLLDAAEMCGGEQVQVVNFSNGERLLTYLIPGARGSGVICLNGPAARKGQVGDKIVAITYCQLTDEEIKKHIPNILILDENNKIVEKLTEV